MCSLMHPDLRMQEGDIMDFCRQTYVLINPASQSGYSLKVWEKELAPLFFKKGIDADVCLSKEKQGLTELAKSITAEKKPVTLIVLGGDGTLGEVLNGIADFSLVELGYIPTGSSNDFGRAIGQTSPLTAAEAILEGKEPRLLDLGEVTWTDPESGRELHRLFLVSAGLGFDAACCEMADRSRWKKALNRIHLGKLIYLFSAIRLILTSKLEPMEISFQTPDPENDGIGLSDLHKDPDIGKVVIHFDHVLFAACMNHPYEGGGFMFCPESKADDGILDFCVAADISRLRFFALFPTAYSGGHVGRKGISIGKGSSLIFQAVSPKFLHADGEVLGKTSKAEIRVQKQILRILN